MTDEKKYRTEVPNIIDDLGLDPHERALYVHYKRSCGGNDCEWIESVRITGQRTKMSHTRAASARASLVERGLIQLIPKGNDGTAVKIVNIWELNTLFYQDDDRPDIDGWTVKQLKEKYQGVNNVYTLEPSVNNMNTSVNNVYNKKEPLENKQIQELPKGNGATPQPPLVILSEEPTAEPIPEENLLPDSPELLLLFEKINRNRKLRSWGPVKKFNSIEQKQSFQESASLLGIKEFEAGITKGMKKGLTNLSSLVNWIGGYKTKNGANSGRHNQGRTTQGQSAFNDNSGQGSGGESPTETDGISPERLAKLDRLSVTYPTDSG